MLATSAAGQQTAAVPLPAPPPVVNCDAAVLDKSDLLGIVLFSELSDSLQAEDRKILSALLNSAKAGGYSKLLVVGFADQAGSPMLNLRLGGLRATAVAQYVTPLAGSITSTAMTCGEDLPILPTTGGGHANNRRVEVRGIR